MTPQQKAEALLERFHQAMYEPIGSGIISYVYRSRECALVCVDEILSSYANNPYYDDDVISKNYWQQVKEHLLNQ